MPEGAYLLQLPLVLVVLFVPEPSDFFLCLLLDRLELSRPNKDMSTCAPCYLLLLESLLHDGVDPAFCFEQLADVVFHLLSGCDIKLDMSIRSSLSITFINCSNL